MIQIHYNLSELDKMAADFYKEVEKEFELKNKLEGWEDDELKPVMEYLAEEIESIICGRPDKLECHIGKLALLIDKAKRDYKKNNPHNDKGKNITAANLNTWVKSEIFKVFNYDTDDNSFTKVDGGRIAYKHAKKLNMNTCPYCNANFTFTIKSRRLKCRPQFDHFYNKGRYPYLALSFYNLIPSCALCNSGALKGQKQFDLSKNIHPFLESIDTIYQFRTKVNAVDFLVNGNNFQLQMILSDKKNINDPDVIKATGNIETFALNDRYAFHKDIAEIVIKNSYIYCNSAIYDLYNSLEVNGKKIFDSEHSIKEQIFGNYLKSSDFHKRIHTKLVRDIAEEFGLII